MEFEKNYITILIDSLHKKLTILDGILEENEKQKELASQETLDLELLEPTLTKKQEYIDQLNELDEGFQTIYDRVKSELTEHPENHKDEIDEMKSLISRITGKSIAVQAEEARNKQVIQEHFNKFKREIRQSKSSTKAVTNYYNNMNKLTNIEPQFLDRKK